MCAQGDVTVAISMVMLGTCEVTGTALKPLAELRGSQSPAAAPLLSKTPSV